MLKLFIKRLTNLMTIKSILTLTLLFLFTYLAVNGMNNEQVNNILTTLVGFYFGSKLSKEDDQD